jgi:hypothetical protein
MRLGFRRNWTLGTASLALTAACLILLGRAIYAWTPAGTGNAEALRGFLLPLRDFRPEPAERRTFLLSLALGPFLLAGFYEGLRRLAARARPSARAEAVLLGAACAALAATAAASLRGGRYFYLEGTVFLVHPWFAAAAGASIFALAPRRLRAGPTLERALGAATLALFAYGFVARLFTGVDPYVLHNHFAAAFSPLVQIRGGRWPLVDYPVQYGLYPVFLAPLFGLVGLGVLRYSAAMSALLLLCHGLFLWFLVSAVKRKWTAFLALSAAVFFMEFHPAWGLAAHGKLDFYDPYFQYAPVRLLFPALAAAFALWDWRRPDERRRILFAGVLAVGVYWNLDSGLPAVLAWLGVMSFEALFVPGRIGRREAARLWLAAGAAAAAGGAVLTAALRLLSGRWPDWSLFVAFQKQFYLLGYYMLPMRPFHAWNLVVLLYAAGLLASWVDAREGSWDARSRASLVSAALGFGLFSYYQGRSHDLVLFSVVMPAFCLLGLGVDRLLDVPRRGLEGAAARAAASLALLVLAVFCLRGLSESAFFNRSIRERLWTRREAYPGFRDDLAFLRARTAAGAPTEFLSYAAPIYYLATGTRALTGPDLVELGTKAEAGRLLASLRAHPEAKVFVDRAVLKVRVEDTNPVLSATLDRFLPVFYQVAAVSPSGRLVALEPRR